jgi:hypothetical protein
MFCAELTEGSSANMGKKVVHHGWDNAYPESNELMEWGITCGLNDVECSTTDWDYVTCKRCLGRRATEAQNTTTNTPNRQ